MCVWFAYDRMPYALMKLNDDISQSAHAVMGKTFANSHHHHYQLAVNDRESGIKFIDPETVDCVRAKNSCSFD